mmetsp:Transcript_39287/g.57798  ORF Transcript_39287/g.57798 Transcript_39287/m.57798 type:complete len:525 (-) Transcript_39287:244-1818(-)|eukprot:CAMPEP_0195509460 /NCGR_PEP_ID=MMETSP0794_2-20130614/2390_1 /TAXON_ID=515487 /ORGANISM="Stephanopyxis turris, Strain CCMP 815" /LENGTH=524 /DNA_ID=CAMNT_0040636685 /DNA_START=67 /DNA_END=1641 /DNA_ORIENTATION=+
MLLITNKALLIPVVVFLHLPLSTNCIPSEPKFYKDQLVNHLSDDAIQTSKEQVWSQRYYSSSKYFDGAGNPIVLIVGGESAIEPETGLFYPFVTEHLAKTYNAMVIQPEHRFYGSSQPLGSTTNVKNSDLARLMTSEQAMHDAIRLVRHIQTKELKCSIDRSSPNYCPIITVGGSYPGFLSAMMRLLHPDVIDGAYAASAPMKFYSQQVNQGDYYNLITESAERVSSGCPAAVKASLMEVVHSLTMVPNNSVLFPKVAAKLGICTGSIPSYIRDNVAFQEEIMMVIGYTFANYNMQNYPPSQDTMLAKSCQLFQDSSLNSFQKVATFLSSVEQQNTTAANCFNMKSQLPAGDNATITSGDWSGVGTAWNGHMWDFQTCSLLVEKIGFSESSMFPKRLWSINWLTNHCWNRYAIVPKPYLLVEKWGFNDLVSRGASRILFTNGLNDGWSVGAIKQDLSASILALNFINGAHHSDLSHEGPSEDDTIDIQNGYTRITGILGDWLEGIKRQHKHLQHVDKIVAMSKN